MSPRLTMVALAGLCCAATAAHPAAAQAFQYGLRLDSRSSMQWSADTLMLVSNSASYLPLPVGSIRDIWLGPKRGQYVVSSAKGLGLLLGSTTLPSAHPFEPDEILRSSRPEVVFACVSSTAGPHRRFVEWRSGSRQRQVLEVPYEVIDFDVDVIGRIVMLTREGKVIASDGKRFSLIPLGGAGAPPAGATIRRVFVDAGGEEISLLTDTALFRVETATSAWTRLPVDARTDALVRHAASRRMKVEPRFVVK